MKISESEVILIVVLVLIGFVLYTSRTMKTTSVKTVGGKHTKEPMCSFDADCDKYFPGYAGVECINGICLPGGYNPYR